MKKKSKISISKGLTRIYFTISAIWIIMFIPMWFQELHNWNWFMALCGLFVVFAPIPVWYILTRWFIAGFINK